MDKPLGKITLEEVQTWCKENDDCPGCPCYTPENGCLFASCAEAAEWPLDTEQEDPPAAADTNVGHKPAKPRLAEVLGVDVGERFLTPWFPTQLYVSDDGDLIWDENDNVCFDGKLLQYIINYPESIIRIPRLTEAELAICKYVGAKWVSKDKIRDDGGVSLWRKKPDYWDELYDSEESDALIATFFDKDVFSNVHPGDCICVEEVTGE